MVTQSINLRRVLITGAAGFIGSSLTRNLVASEQFRVLGYDKLTYAGTLTSLSTVIQNPNFQFVCGDICDISLLTETFHAFDPDIVVHLAAESHVDRSIDEPGAFIETNLVGTYRILQVARQHWLSLSGARKEAFRFHHVSTDEVFGALGTSGKFTEETVYDPRSPYSASKAGADHLVRAWFHTFGLPVIITNCSNNFGPYHFPEKLIPLTILRAISGRNLPIYGSGENIRDWLYVDDHARAIQTVFQKGKIGQTYAVGGNSERRNIDVVKKICEILDRIIPMKGQHYEDQISYVDDRPGHDFRYAIDCSKIKRDLGWEPKETFDTGLEKTIRWYINNEAWWRPLVENQNSLNRRGLTS